MGVKPLIYDEYSISYKQIEYIHVIRELYTIYKNNGYECKIWRNYIMAPYGI